MTALASQPVVGVFAKWPAPGHVKTRLAAATSPEWAATVARAFLGDTLDRLAGLAARRVLAYSPTHAEFTEFAAGRYDLWPQGDGDLGQRMARFFRAALATGNGRAVLVGADSPTLPVEHVELALRQLESADVVLGPATDGGYYLVGCRGRVPPIFEGVNWGSSGVLAVTVQRLHDANLRLAVLPPWYDVDTLGDWQMLRGHLAALRAAGCDPGVPRTEALEDYPA